MILLGDMNQIGTPTSAAANTATSPLLCCTQAITRTLRCSSCTLTVTSTVEWKQGLLSAEYRLFTNGNLPSFHQSREMEISLWELSGRNFARILRYFCMRATPYKHDCPSPPTSLTHRYNYTVHNTILHSKIPPRRLRLSLAVGLTM